MPIIHINSNYCETGRSGGIQNKFRKEGGGWESFVYMCVSGSFQNYRLNKIKIITAQAVIRSNNNNVYLFGVGPKQSQTLEPSPLWIASDLTCG